MTARQVVVTGIGAVTPIGVGLEAYWSAVQRGENGIRRIRSFDPSGYRVTLAGEALDFRHDRWIDPKLTLRTDRWTWIALAATEMALADAGLELSRIDPYAVGIILASCTGGNAAGQKELQTLWSEGPDRVSAFLSIIWFYAAATGQISILHGAKGPACAMVSEGAGGLDALAHARRIVNRGADIVISGGCEAPIVPYAWVAQGQNGRLSTRDDPATAYRPFDLDANGYIPGEGGAILLVEALDHALKRGADRIYGEIAGHASTHDAYHHSDYPPDPRQLARAMSLAIERSGLTPEEIDVVFADAGGTPEGDSLEAQAIHRVFGTRAATIPVTAPKSMVGRLYAGGAALDVATALLALRDGIIPPTINVETLPPGYGLDLVRRHPRRAALQTALVVARGFGGFNSAMVLRAYHR